MKRIFSLLLLLISWGAKAQSETEPNNSFETANSLSVSSTRTGTVNTTDDQYDYYRAVLPVDGTMKIYVQATNTSTSGGYLYMYGYDRRKANGQIFGDYIGTTNTSAGATVLDTITVYGRAADTFYLRMESIRTFSYSLRYEMADTSQNDVEPNNTFTETVPIAHLEEKKGHIGYRYNGTEDQFDYYRTVLPVDGTMKIYVQGRNNDGAGGYLYMYGYDRRKANGQVFGDYIGTTNTVAGVSISDTITVYGRAADTFYLRLQSTVAFSYTVRYEMADTSTNDAEPNNIFADVIPIAYLEEKKGHIGYRYNGTEDQFDYYRTVLPVDGTMKIYVQGRNNDGAGGYLYMYGYDRRKANGQIFGDYIGTTNTTAGASISDTITVYGRSADTFYFRVQSTAAFSYTMRYEMVDTSQNDVEPNNSFTETVPIAQLEEKKGHIGYRSNGTDDTYDYYKTVFPSDGTLKVYVKARNNDGFGGYLYMYGYDRRRANGQVLGSYVGTTNTTAGTTIFDTLTLQCVAADTFYFRFQSTAAFSYEFKYEVTLGKDTTVKVCPGFTTNIGGLYNTSPFSTVKYENMANPGTAISPNNVGNGVYRLSVYNGQECTRDTAFITVALNPKPDLGPDLTRNICVGSTFNLTGLYTDALLSYSWNTPNPGAVVAGTYTVIATNITGCKDTALVTIAYYAQPVASFTINNNQQCFRGNNFVFTNTSNISTGSLTYQWSFGDNTNASTLNTSHTYAAAGIYNVKLLVTSNNGCKDSILQNITVNQNPDLGTDQSVTVNCLGGTANITTLYNISGYASVVYSATTPTAALPGVYNLIVTNTSGCKDTAIITVLAQPLSIVPTAGANTKPASRECTDAQGWTHYYNDNSTPADVNDDILVLSIKKNGNNIGAQGDGTFQLKTVATTGAGSNTGVLITNAALTSFKYWSMNRYWEVIPTSQPTSNVGVRFYYTTQDLADINGSHPYTSITPENLVLYKTMDGSPDPTTNLAGATSINKLTFGMSAGTSTFTYNTLNSNTQYVEFQVSSFSGGGAGVPDTSQALPLNLLAFTASLRNQQVIIDWKTAQEVNTARFTIQRSTDGNSFQNIGIIQASGFGASTYTFTDQYVKNLGVSKVFYRLQIADKDGTTYYSSVSVVLLISKNTFSISPNPASSVVYVKGSNMKQVQLVDHSGRMVLTENISNETLHQMNVRHLAKGIYLIKIMDKDGSVQTGKLLIQ